MFAAGFAVSGTVVGCCWVGGYYVRGGFKVPTPIVGVPQDLTAVSGSIFLLLPLGAGAILGVYVTVLVTTSRMCRMLDLDSRLACPGVVGAPGPGRPGVSGAAGRFVPPGVSANLRDLRAASQSKGDRTDAALSGDLGE